MTKKKKSYICTECGYKSSQWIGKCNSCLSWNSFEDESDVVKNSMIKSINCLKNSNELTLKLNDSRYEKLLGKEIPKSSLMLFSAEPGVGKSTFVLFLMASIYAKKVLYISSEESETQLYQRCKRLGILDRGIDFVFAASWNQVREEVSKYDLVILDSIQAFQHEDFQGQVGSTAIVKEIVNEILSFSKLKSITFLIISQVNKEGAIAGPKALEHMVDISLILKKHKNGIDVSTLKNRFAPIGEVLTFRHQKDGIKLIESERAWSSKISNNEQFGISLSVVVMNEDIYLNKTEALVRISKIPKNIVYNYEVSRLNVLIAILEDFYEIDFREKEIYLNNITEIKYKSSEIDLSVAASILSKIYKKSLKQNWLFIGELSLTGNILKYGEDNIIKKLLNNKRVERIIVNSTISDPRVYKIQNLKQMAELLSL